MKSKLLVFQNKKIQIILLSIITLLVIILSYYFYSNKIFYIHFVDEEDNFILGNYLLQNERIYSDLFSHHQPLGYVMSAGIQEVTSPNSIYLLVKRHREFLIFWSIGWILLLAYRFRFYALLPIIIYEITKIFMLGNLFLSESLAAYPTAFLVLSLITQEKIKKYELLFLGFVIGFLGMILAPIWPMLLFCFILLLYKNRPIIKTSLLLAIGIILFILICVPFIDIYYYFHNAFYINFTYYIPIGDHERQPLATIKSFISPLTALVSWNGGSTIELINRYMAVIFFSSGIYLVSKKQYKKVLVVFTLLGLLNIRYANPSGQYFGGFHLIPWYISFLICSFYLSLEVFKLLKAKYIKFSILVFIIFTIFISGYYSSFETFKKRDIANDFDINYSRQYTFGEAIKIMKVPGDRLFVVPDEWLLYWQAAIGHNTKMVNFYPWMQQVPELNGYVVESFKTNPPQFFYCQCNADGVYFYSDKYTRLRKDGNDTELWVLTDRLNSLSSDQKEKLRFHRFELQ